MNETIQDMAFQLFFDICKKKPTDIDVLFLEQIYFPTIKSESILTICLPIPRIVDGAHVIQDNIFSDLEISQYTIFALFFASICHMAGHAEITNYEKYQNWMIGKNKKRAQYTVELIEDIRVDDFLKNKFPEYHSEIMKIEEVLNAINEEKESTDIHTYSKNKFLDRFIKNNENSRELQNKILETDFEDGEKITHIADKIYNSNLIKNERKLSFKDHVDHRRKIEKWNRNITIKVEGKFGKIVEEFTEIWTSQQKRKSKVVKKYGKITEGLEFDKINFAAENIGEYLRLKNATHLFLKKMSSQLKKTPNIMDEGMPEDVGLIEMQAAIQSIAAQNTSMQIFEQDDYRRIEEEWAILLDTSSSMKLSFDEMKKFAICLGEAANEVNSKNGKWGFFTFNNNFTIIKDHYEKFDQNSKARIGGIEIKGFSFIADAVKLCARMLEKDNIERKYIFLITDGQALGTQQADKKMQEAIENARKRGITIVGIGANQLNTKIFSMCMPYDGLRKTIARFLNAYTNLAGDNL